MIFWRENLLTLSTFPGYAKSTQAYRLHYSSPYFAHNITIQNASYSPTHSPYDPLKERKCPWNFKVAVIRSFCGEVRRSFS